MPFTDQLVIYLYSYLPAILLALFFWWMDRFEREPLLLIALAFIWGAFGAGLLSGFWNTFFHIILEIYESNQSNEILTAVIVAPVVEEFTKGIFVLFVLWLGSVDNLTDGILLGIVVGLGFAASENVYYAIDEVYPASGELAMWNNLWFREIHTTLLHASATAVWGGMIGYARRFRGGQKIFTLFNGYVLAMVTHAFWNFLASYAGMFESRVNLVEIVMKLELAAIFGFLMLLFVLSVMQESRIIACELMEECANGVLPPEHVAYFASLVRLPSKFSLPKKTHAGEYAKLGVRLAFRKRDYRFRPDGKLFDEIRELRTRLAIASEYQPDSLSLKYGR